MKFLNTLQKIASRVGRLLGPLLAIVFFVLGCIYYFPIQSLEHQINSQLSRQTGQDIKIIKPKLGTGLGLGLMSGGLIALKAERLEIYLPRKAVQIDCHNFTVTPSLLSLLILKAQIAVQCELDPEGDSSVVAIIKAPIWSFKEATVSIELDEILLDPFAKIFKAKGWKGRLDGELFAQGLLENPGTARFDWDISGSEFSTPAVRSDFFNLPPFAINKIESQGNFKNPSLQIDKFEIHIQNSVPIWLSFGGNLGLDPNGLPINGTLKGKMKSDLDFEKENLKELNLDLLLGKVKDSGLREFTKEVKGNVLSLMMNPPIE